MKKVINLVTIIGDDFMKKEDLSERQIIIGFKTVVLGLCLYIIELLSLPIFGYLQKLQVSGQGFYSDFIKYMSKQPYPLIFTITGAIVIMGIIFMFLGFEGKKEKR